MRSILQYISILILAMLFVACSKETSIPEYTKQVIADTDLKRSYEDETFTVSCHYLPNEFLALSELKGRINNNGTLDKEIFKKEMEKFSNASYFSLSIGLKNKKNIIRQLIKSQDEYALVTSELTYNMMRDVYMLVDKRDTIYPITYNYTNSYGNGSDVKLLFAFPSVEVNKMQKNIELVYRDKVFGIKNDILFSYESENLKKETPRLKELR